MMNTTTNEHQQQQPPITSFKDEYAWLSNFSPVTITVRNYVFKCVEAAYQACKCEHEEDIPKFQKLNGGQSKAMRRQVDLRDDWPKIKLEVMTLLVRMKFKTEPYRTLLIQTGTRPIVEGNTWCDNFFGNCTCTRCKNKPGQNNLGKILMQIREELQKGI